VKHILVALATTRHSEALGPLAMTEARGSESSITLLLVHERDEIDRVYQLRSDPRLVGTVALEDVLAQIEEEHRRILEEHAREIERLATEAKVPVERRVVHGRYEDQVERLVAEGSWDVVLWLRHNRGFIARFFLGADEDEIVRVEPRRPPGR
jgi:nucleotide-binding universal stress UspA family protein